MSSIADVPLRFLPQANTGGYEESARRPQLHSLAPRFAIDPVGGLVPAPWTISFAALLPITDCGRSIGSALCVDAEIIDSCSVSLGCHRPGALALAAAAGEVRWYPLDPRWIVLCTLTLVGSVATLKMRAAPVSFSISDTFTFTTLLLLGPGPATITASLEALT